jgi:hypothetical protein
MPEDLLTTITDNRPFPESDIETIPSDLFTLPPECTLSSFLRLDTALGRIAGPDAAALDGLLAADPATHRFTVLSSTSGGASFSIIAAVRRDLGARDQVRAALEPAIPSTALISSAAEIGPDRAIVFSLSTALKFSRTPRVRFAFHWLREVSTGNLQGEFGNDIDSGLEAGVHAVLSGSFLVAVALDRDQRLRLRLFKHKNAALDLHSSLRVEAGGQTPLAANRENLIRTILVAGEAVPAADPGVVETVAALVDSVYSKAILALERKLGAALSWRCGTAAQGAALVDCSFDFTPGGLGAYRAALAGDFSPLVAGNSVKIFKATFTEAVGGQSSIELHLPFFDRKEWGSRWDALARAEVVAGEDGRLITYTVAASDRLRQKNAYQSTLALAGSLLFPKNTPEFELTYTDSRTGDAAHLARGLAPLLTAYGFPPEAGQWLQAAAAARGTIQTALVLRVPGTLAGAWLRAPEEQDPRFFDIYSSVSLTVQRVMRRWLPFVYFSNLDRYDDYEAAYPLIFYQSTRPFPGQPRSDFTYDVVSPDCPGVARPWAAHPLASELARVEQALIAAGRPQAARYYEPWRAPEILADIVRKPRLVNALLMGDTFFMGRLVHLGIEARRLAARLQSDPQRATRELVDFASDFAATFHRKLRRLYGGQDFVAFGSLLLVEATRALGAALDGGAAISATLRLASGDREQTFVNTAYRPD